MSSVAAAVTLPAAAIPADTALALIVQAAGGGYVHSGDPLEFRYVVMNTSGATLHGIAVDDDHVAAADLDCPQDTLAAGDYEICSGTYNASAADVAAGSVTVTATAAGLAPNDDPLGSSPASTTVLATPLASLSLAASTTSTGFSAAGTALAFSYLVTNTGNVALHGVGVTDDHVSAANLSCPSATLAAGDSETCTGAYTTTAADVDSSVVSATSTATAEDPDGVSVTSSSSSVSVAGNLSTAVSIAVTSSTSSYSGAGAAIGYRYVITNSGATTLHGVSVADDLVAGGGVSCPAGVLAAGASKTCTATYATTQADVDLGSVTDSAVATAFGPSGSAVSSAPAGTTVTAAASAALSLAASPLSPTYAAAGAVISYAYLVTNTGAVTVHGLAVNDSRVLSAALTCPQSSLAPGASMACTGTTTATQADVDAGSVQSSSTATGLTPGGVVVSSASSAVTAHAAAVSAGSALSIVSQPATPGYLHSGDAIVFRYLVMNTSAVTIHGIGVTDDHVPAAGISCPQGTLSPAAYEVCTGAYTATAADVSAGSVTATAAAAGTGPDGTAVASASASTTVSLTPVAGLTLSASSSASTLPAAGAPLPLSYLVTNTGNVALHGVGVTDDHVAAAALSCPGTTLAAGASETCSGTYPVSQADVDAGSVTATSTASATDPAGTAVSSAGSTVTVSGSAVSAVTLAASTSTPTFAAVGNILAYSYLVTNTGGTTLHGVTVLDDHVAGTGISCPSANLASGARETCSGSYVVTQADLDAGAVTSAATVSAFDPHGAALAAAGQPVTATVGGGSSGLTISATASPATFHAAGDTLSMWYVVRNTGSLSLHGLSVSDDHVPGSALSCVQTTLRPGDTVACTGTYTVTQADVDAGAVMAVSTASALDATGNPVTSTGASVSVTGASSSSLDLAESSPTTSYAAVGDVVVLRFALTNSGATTLHGIAVTDSLSASDLACPQGTLSPGGSETCTGSYAITQADIDAGSVADTGSAAARDPQGAPVTATASGVSVPADGSSGAGRLTLQASSPTVSYAQAGDAIALRFALSNTGTSTLTSVSVEATRPAAQDILCPQGTLAPGGSETCTASLTATQADVDAGAVSVDATAVATGVHGGVVTSAPGTVTVAAAATAALTLHLTALTPWFHSAGDALAYRYTVTNSGSSTLHAVAVSDTRMAMVDCPAIALPPGAALTCTASAVAGQADLSAGAADSAATASALSPSGVTVSSSQVSVSVPDVGSASMLVAASSPTASFAQLGDPITYSFQVTNSGVGILTGLTLDAGAAGSATCDRTSLAPSATTTCTATTSATQADLDTGSQTVAGTATATASDGSSVTATAAAVTVPADAAVTAAIELDSALTSAGYQAAGDTLAFDDIVTNIGATTVHGLAVADDRTPGGFVGCPSATIAPGESVTCTTSVSVSQADVDAGAFDLHASATAVDPHGVVVSASPASLSVHGTAISSLGLDAAALTPQFSAAGDVIAARYRVTNTGVTRLTGVAVSDDHVAPADLVCPQGDLYPGRSETCTGTYAATQADADSGSVTFTSTAAATDPFAALVASPASSFSSTGPATGAIALVATSAEPGFTRIGDTVDYRLEVTNAGPVTLSGIGVAVADGAVSDTTCPQADLAPGESETCTAQHLVTAGDAVIGSIAATFAAFATDPHGTEVDSPAQMVTVSGPSGSSIAVTPTAQSSSYAALGDTVAFDYVVSNTGHLPLDGITLDGGAGISTACPQQTLDPGASMTCTGVDTITQDDLDTGSVTSTAMASATDSLGTAITSPSQSASIAGAAVSSIDVTVSSTSGTFSAAGDRVDFSYQVTNTGATTLHAVTVADDHVAGNAVTCPQTTLAPGATITCTGSYAATAADVHAATLTDTAIASAVDGHAVSVTSAASQTTVVGTPGSSLSLLSFALTPGYNTAGQTVVFRYSITNTGDTTLGGVGVRDDHAAAVQCLAATLAPGATTTCTGSYAVAQADLDAGSITGLSTASGTAPGGATVVSAQSAVLLYSTAGMHLSVAATSSGTGFSHAGQMVGYQFTVTNGGTSPLESIHLTTFGAATSAVQCPQQTLAAGQSMACTAVHSVSQDDVDARTLTTTVEAAGQNAQGVPISSDPAAVTVIGRPVPAVRFAVKVSSKKLSKTGAKLAFTFTVTNSGDMTMHKPGVAVAIKHFGVLSCPTVTLAPGASAVCKLTHAVTKAEYVGKKESVAMRGTLHDPSELVISSPLVRIKLSRTGK